jgi:hypothetical protein
MGEKKMKTPEILLDPVELRITNLEEIKNYSWTPVDAAMFILVELCNVSKRFFYLNVERRQQNKQWSIIVKTNGWLSATEFIVTIGRIPEFEEFYYGYFDEYEEYEFLIPYSIVESESDLNDY